MLNNCNSNLFTKKYIKMMIIFYIYFIDLSQESFF